MKRKITIKTTARPVGGKTIRVSTSVSSGNKTITKTKYIHK
jgi:hypothetical protein